MLLLLLHHHLLLLLLLLVRIHLHVFLATHFGNNAHLNLLTTNLEVVVLTLLDLRIDSFDLELVLLSLGLEMFDFSNHLFKLLGALLQRLLVKHKLLSDFGSTLLSEDILQLDVKLFFLLNQDVFLHDLFGLSNQPLLQRLNLLDQLVSVDISGFKFAPSVHVQGLSELILKVFGFLLSFK